MTNLSQELDALETVCDSRDALISFHLPQLQKVVETIKILPQDQQQEYLSRLERISTILEGQMMALSEELEELRKKIPASQINSLATRAYQQRSMAPGIAAVIPMKPTSAE